MKKLTVFCSSKNNLNPIYYEQCKKLISLLNPNKISIVYGGGTSGIMGTVRTTFLENSGIVISSNMKKFAEPGIYDDYIFDNLDDRQKKLMELGDGYLILPGGYGTHFEMLEAMTNNDIGESNKPVFIFNCRNIFDNLLLQLENLVEEGFITRDLEKINAHIISEPSILANIINDSL
jgi:uncharacterized protein (TIGR00730 family)